MSEEKTLFVRGIPPDTRTSDVRDVFEKYGKLRDVYIPLNYYTRRQKDFAYVKYYIIIRFENPEHAEDAMVEAADMVIAGQRVVVEWAKGQRKDSRDMRRQASRYDRSRSPRRYRSRSPRRDSRDRYRRRDDSRDRYSRDTRDRYQRRDDSRDRRRDVSRDRYRRADSRDRRDHDRPQKRDVSPRRSMSPKRSPRRSVSIEPRE